VEEPVSDQPVEHLVQNNADQQACSDVLQSTGVDPDRWTSDGVASQQLADQDIRPVFSLLMQGAEKPSWDDIALHSETTKALWQQWDRLTVCDGMLYRKFESPDGLSVSRQLVVPAEDRFKFIKMAHEGLTGGHLGRRRTEDQVRRRAYWPGWTKDVSQYLRTCSPCAQYHRGALLRLARLKPMLVGEPLERMSIDIT